MLWVSSLEIVAEDISNLTDDMKTLEHFHSKEALWQNR